MKQNGALQLETATPLLVAQNGRLLDQPHAAKERIAQSSLFTLAHPGQEDVFSGYGLTLWPGDKRLLVGLLMVDRPHPVDPRWLKQVEAIFGGYQLLPMTANGERGIACQMQIEPESQRYLCQFEGLLSTTIRSALEPLLVKLPQPVFSLAWKAETGLWHSRFAEVVDLPTELRQLLAETGYGCLAVETNIGIVHVCHAADADIDGFVDKAVRYRWQLIKMATAPLIRLEVIILDRLDKPYRFESFLNIADPDQDNILTQLTGQMQLYLAFYGDDLSYRFTKAVAHDAQQWQQLDELTAEAYRHWQEIPLAEWDFDRAKADYMRRFG